MIPVFRSAQTLPDLIERVCRSLDGAASFELLLVDDASPDDTWQVLAAQHALRPGCVRALRLAHNVGQHRATWCGIEHARGSVVLTMDDDLQHPPEEVAKLLAAWQHGAGDLIYGSYHAKRHAPWRNVGSRLLGMAFRWTTGTLAQVTSFRLFTRGVVDRARSLRRDFIFIDELLVPVAQQIAHVAVRHDEAPAGRSRYSAGRLAAMSLQWLGGTLRQHCGGSTIHAAPSGAAACSIAVAAALGLEGRVAHSELQSCAP